MGFNMIYWTPISGSYFLMGSILGKMWKFWGKKGRFSRRIWPDWGNTARADMAGLGSIGLVHCKGNCSCLLPENLDVKLQHTFIRGNTFVESMFIV